MELAKQSALFDGVDGKEVKWGREGDILISQQISDFIFTV